MGVLQGTSRGRATLLGTQKGMQREVLEKSISLLRGPIGEPGRVRLPWRSSGGKRAPCERSVSPCMGALSEGRALLLGTLKATCHRWFWKWSISF
jgi:hypothetical protein